MRACSPPLPSLQPRPMAASHRFVDKPVKDGELPPDEAMESVLPKYIVPNHDKEHGHTQEEFEHLPMSLLDHQARDLENYRDAVHRMGQDILNLTKQVQQLENSKSQLRRQLSGYQDAAKLLMDSSEIDGLTKPELAERYAALKQKLASQTTELKTYKERVHILQNEIIKKNDQEREYIKISQAHVSQQQLLQRLQEKVQNIKKLEAACQKQERVINRMEKIIEKQKNQSDNQAASPGARDTLLEENQRLRQELYELENNFQNHVAINDFDVERLELYQALEKADGRIMSLEKQLSENSRQWGKEKAELVTKLNEAEYGFDRTSQIFPNNYQGIPAVTSDEALISKSTKKSGDQGQENWQMVWRLLNLIMTVFFTMAASVNINDSDWFIWVPIYLIPGCLSLTIVIHPIIIENRMWTYATVIHLTLCLAYSAYQFAILVEVYAGYFTNPLQQEEGREFAGLLIIIAWLAVCRFTTIPRPSSKHSSMINAFLLVAVILSILPLFLWALCFVGALHKRLGHCTGMFVE